MQSTNGGSQADLFGPGNEHPESGPVDEWSCQNGHPERANDNSSLPSVQFAIPQIIQLHAFSFNTNMLYTEDGARKLFLGLRAIYRQLISDSGEKVMTDLDRGLSFILAFVKHAVPLSDYLRELYRIAREFKCFLMQVGTLSRYIISDEAFATRNIKMNFQFHALMMIWLKAFQICGTHFEYFGYFTGFYSTENSLSSLNKISMILTYGMLLSSARVGRTFVCECVKLTWRHIYLTNSDIFWPNMEKLYGLCAGDIDYSLSGQIDSGMFLDLCTTYGKVSPKTFLKVLCELGSANENSFTFLGRGLSSYVDCLRLVVRGVEDKKYVMRKLYVLFGNLDGDKLVSMDSIMQHFFSCLCSDIMGISEQGWGFYPSSGKAWMYFVEGYRSDDELPNDECSEWTLFIRLMSLLMKKSETVGQAMRSRIFAKFTTKRYRQMPIRGVIWMFSLFMTSMIGSDMEETANKIILLAKTTFDPTDNLRHEIMLRVVLCVKYTLDKYHCDSSQAAETLIAMMGQLGEKSDIPLHAECCLCLDKKMLEVRSLPLFLPYMDDKDMEQLFAVTVNCKNEINPLFTEAMERLNRPNYKPAVNYVAEQLKIRLQRDLAGTSQSIRSLVRNFLTDKAYKPETYTYFLQQFINKSTGIVLPTEVTIPIWLAAILNGPDTDEMINLSLNFCRSLTVSFYVSKISFERFDGKPPSLTNLAEWLFQTASANTIQNRQWALEHVIEWSELLIAPLQSAVMKADCDTDMRCCRITSYFFLYATHIIYKNPFECNFNRSPFVQMCKIAIQGVLLQRTFPIEYLRDVVPNYMTGILTLPAHSVPYLLRVVMEIMEKCLYDHVLSGCFANMLTNRALLVHGLYSASEPGSNCFDFLMRMENGI